MDLKESEFEELDFSDQVQLIKKASFSEKAELIIRSNNPKESIENLALEEFVLVYNQSTIELKEEIVKYADSNQLVFASDIECWQRDEVKHEGLIAWMSILKNASPEILYKWTLQTDYEFICGALIPHIEVMKTEHLEVADDYIGDRPFFTLDQLYYICIQSEEFDVVRDFIEILFEHSKQMYLQIMEGLISESEVEAVEEAYQLRNHRMSQIGFPEKDEAMRIYKPLEQWADLEKRHVKNDYDDSFYLTWNLPAFNLKSDLFLDSVLEFFRENSELLDCFHEELVSLSNKIVVIEDIDFKSEHQIIWCANRAKSIVSIGLEEISRGEVSLACGLLKDHYLENFFRYGIRILKQLKEMALVFLSRFGGHSRGEFIQFMGSPHDSLVRGLLKLVPVKHVSEGNIDIFNCEDFRGLEEVFSAKNHLELLNDVFVFIEEHLGEDWRVVLENKSMKLNLRNRISLTPLINTVFVRFVLSGEMQFEPFKSSDIKLIVDKVFESKKIPRKISESCKKIFFEALKMPDDKAVEIFGAFLNTFEEEFGFLNMNYKIDPQFLETIFILTGED